MLKRRDDKTVAKVIPNHNHSLLNKIGSRLGATMDRRAFLKRSGIGVGAGAVVCAGAGAGANVGVIVCACV